MANKIHGDLKTRKLRRKRKMLRRNQLRQKVREQEHVHCPPSPEPIVLRFRPYTGVIHQVAMDRQLDLQHTMAVVEDIFAFILLYIGITGSVSFGYLLTMSPLARTLVQDLGFVTLNFIFNSM
ncbi:hypothetical protein EGW08_011032 [Elysia chlorotica]|uniref:Uncharacterized protein n=1 Tax=Elysia chlorotica TaxID=188477 RepID=A0A3S1HK95_ELYCH|nr:hypothetical protein EGW08_011032 [Elysia chlorotica]